MGIVIERTAKSGNIVVDSYQHPKYDDFIVAFKAKHNCRRCHGRGKLSFDHPGKGIQWTETCDCIHRKQK